jgi:hypothetical protein
MRNTWGPGNLVAVMVVALSVVSLSGLALSVLALSVLARAAQAEESPAAASTSAKKSVPDAKTSAPDAKTSVPDSCDLRFLEVNSVQPGPLWAALLKAVRVKQPDLAASLSSKAPDEASLRKAVERAMSPGAASDSDRDLLLLTADQFLRHHGDPGLPVTLDDELDPAWMKLGFRSYGEPTSAYWEYCGSILPTIASGAGKDEWADRALLVLLDQGWVTDCSGSYDEANSGSDLYVPVIAHGEEFLAQHLGSSVWGAVALRVAMAHETAWSLAKGKNGSDYKDPSGNGKHRERAMLLYRELATGAKDPRLRVALQSRARALETDRDTGCRVYYVAGDE